MSDYWREAVETAMDECGLHSLVPADKWDELAQAMRYAAEMQGEFSGRNCIPNPETERANRLGRELAAERAKVQCKPCNGTGRIITAGPHHSSDTSCWKCRGEGKHTP